MPDVSCPECGHVSSLVAIRRAAEEFCPHCDYPLFWAPSATAITERGSSNDATLRRLPGAGGRHRVGTKVCPECGELNTITATHCSRCDADLDPKPAPLPEPTPPPPPEPIPEPEPVARTPWWWWALGAALAVTILVILFVLFD